MKKKATIRAQLLMYFFRQNGFSTKFLYSPPPNYRNYLTFYCWCTDEFDGGVSVESKKLWNPMFFCRHTIKRNKICVLLETFLNTQKCHFIFKVPPTPEYSF